MKKFYPLLVVVCSLPLLALGGRGVENFSSIPIPEKNYTARVTDRQGMASEVQMFSWEGQVYFGGYRGDAVFTVSFGKVKRAEFGEADGKGRVTVRFYLKDGSIFEMKMDGTKFFYGKTELGNYRIKVKNVKLIEFL